MTELFRVYLDRTVADDIRFQPYDDHRHMCPVNYMSFYCKWLACRSHLVYPHLLEQAMRQFRHMEFVLRHPSDSALCDVTRGDVDVMYNDFLNHMVPGETRGTVAPRKWICDYVQR